MGALFAVFTFAGCVTTFQTAEVVPPGEQVMGVGAMYPTPLEIYYRRGLTEKMDMGLKADLMLDGAYAFHGDLKYQFLKNPFALSALMGGGTLIYPAEETALLMLYPTLLMNVKGMHFGIRSMVWIELDRTSPMIYLFPGVVACTTILDLDGKLRIFPEISLYYNTHHDRRLLVLPGASMQWDVGGKK
jgi:hypothetical protein